MVLLRRKTNGKKSIMKSHLKSCNDIFILRKSTEMDIWYHARLIESCVTQIICVRIIYSHKRMRHNLVSTVSSTVSLSLCIYSSVIIKCLSAAEESPQLSHTQIKHKATITSSIRTLPKAKRSQHSLKILPWLPPLTPRPDPVCGTKPSGGLED